MYREMFQYISCYSLSLRAYRLVWMIVCFNTSHVTLYQGLWTSWRPHQSFQYISCYSLSPGGEKDTSRTTVSIHLMLLFINMLRCSRGIKRRFNTSHVTLYRGTGKKDGGLFTTFQYISCYSLSVIYSSRSKAKNVVSIHLMLLFIILVGSSLSMKKCFNTSHVTLYLTFQLEVEYIHTSFNTSHVTLYL